MQGDAPAVLSHDAIGAAVLADEHIAGRHGDGSATDRQLSAAADTNIETVIGVRSAAVYEKLIGGVGGQ